MLNIEVYKQVSLGRAGRGGRVAALSILCDLVTTAFFIGSMLKSVTLPDLDFTRPELECRLERRSCLTDTSLNPLEIPLNKCLVKYKISDFCTILVDS